MIVGLYGQPIATDDSEAHLYDSQFVNDTPPPPGSPITLLCMCVGGKKQVARAALS